MNAFSVKIGLPAGIVSDEEGGTGWNETYNHGQLIHGEHFHQLTVSFIR